MSAEISEAAVKQELEEQEGPTNDEVTDTGEPVPAKKPRAKAKPKSSKPKVETAKAKAKRMREERERIERELDEGQKAAEKSRARSESKAQGGKKVAAKKKAATKRGKPKGSHEDYNLGKRLGDDAAFVTAMARYIKKDPEGASWSTVIKAMRADGHAAGQKRARRLFAQAQKAAGSKAKSR